MLMRAVVGMIEASLSISSASGIINASTLVSLLLSAGVLSTLLPERVSVDTETATTSFVLRHRYQTIPHQNNMVLHLSSFWKVALSFVLEQRSLQEQEQQHQQKQKQLVCAQEQQQQQ